MGGCRGVPDLWGLQPRNFQGSRDVVSWDADLRKVATEAVDEGEEASERSELQALVLCATQRLPLEEVYCRLEELIQCLAKLLIVLVKPAADIVLCLP
jgi:hypothetical protein